MSDSNMEHTQGKSVRLSKASEVKADVKKNNERLAKFMASRKSNRKDTMDKLRANRLKLNGLTSKDIGK